MATRSTAVTAAIAAGAALVATGITYASAASEPANTAPIAQQAAPVPAPAAAPAPESALEGSSGDSGRGGGGRGGNDRGDNDRGYGRGEGKGNEGHGEEHEKKRRIHIGRIHVNERDYPAIPDGCIVVVSGLGSTSLNVRNDSKHTVELFNGATCDNGAPIATVGPWSSADGLFPRRVRGGVKVKHGVVGSFRVVKRHHGEKGGGDFGFGGGY
ncbi:MAG: hypothetical protein LBV60_15945 [Streptomyces sp.]|jgi:hypothetical protein|nr:hypothetical protein [Streptomyces sp.]